MLFSDALMSSATKNLKIKKRQSQVWKWGFARATQERCSSASGYHLWSVLKVYMNPKQSFPSLQPVTVMYIKIEGTVDVGFTVESPTTPSPMQQAQGDDCIFIHPA